jgi:GTP 3',8-cyclase
MLFCIRIKLFNISYLCYNLNMERLIDSFGRSFPYIRLSITDVCNFKCGYCLPNGYQKDKSDNRTFLTTEEIGRLAKGLSELGVCKIRLTGGEPTVRNDFFDIVKLIKSNSGIKKIVITTNGYRLDKIANQIVDSGLDGINISIDSLNRDTFNNITGHDRLPEILKGIEKLQQLNFKNIKINAVLLKGINNSEKDFNQWAKFIKDNNIDFRYIELMQTGDNLNYFKKFHISAKVFTEYLHKNDWIYQTLGRDAGPSKNYLHPSYKGKFGVIAPYSKDFCKSCNRLRITARGDLRLCLFGNTGISIRHLIQRDDQLNELKDLILKQLNFKKESHYLELGDTGITPNLSTTGG